MTVAPACLIPRILAIIHEATTFRGPDRMTPTVDTMLADIGADVLALHEIAMAIEDEFGVIATDEEVDTWASVADIVATVHHQLRIEA